MLKANAEHGRRSMSHESRSTCSAMAGNGRPGYGTAPCRYLISDGNMSTSTTSMTNRSEMNSNWPTSNRVKPMWMRPNIRHYWNRLATCQSSLAYGGYLISTKWIRNLSSISKWRSIVIIFKKKGLWWSLYMLLAIGIGKSLESHRKWQFHVIKGRFLISESRSSLTMLSIKTSRKGLVPHRWLVTWMEYCNIVCTSRKRGR